MTMMMMMVPLVMEERQRPGRKRTTDDGTSG
jgi:hypothetical protein